MRNSLFQTPRKRTLPVLFTLFAGTCNLSHNSVRLNVIIYFLFCTVFGRWMNKTSFRNAINRIQRDHRPARTEKITFKCRALEIRRREEVERNHTVMNSSESHGITTRSVHSLYKFSGFEGSLFPVPSPSPDPTSSNDTQ